MASSFGRADSPNIEQVVDGAVRAVHGPVVDDRGGRRRPDARQAIELLSGRPVEIERTGRRTWRRGRARSRRYHLSDHRHVDPLTIDEHGRER